LIQISLATTRFLPIRRFFAAVIDDLVAEHNFAQDGFGGA